MRAGLHDCRCEPRGLRIVQHDDVSNADQTQQVRAIALERRLVVGAFDRSERPAVALGAVQMVVQPFRDLEEAGVAFDHDPTGVHPGTARICKQGLQHLGHAASGRSRVHVQYRPALQGRTRGRSRRLEPVGPFRPYERVEPLKCECLDVDLSQHHLVPPLGARRYHHLALWHARWTARALRRGRARARPSCAGRPRRAAAAARRAR